MTDFSYRKELYKLKSSKSNQSPQNFYQKNKGNTGQTIKTTGFHHLSGSFITPSRTSPMVGTEPAALTQHQFIPVSCFCGLGQHWILLAESPLRKLKIQSPIATF